ncbi:hypothetical protein EYR40_001239 [Pleurotus pulmonarius]|nr:hypothetical protein EYR40_001239 [Pleurotus pulmonarius]
MHRLPLEIKFLILQQVLGTWDTCTIRSCALVCKSWHEPCLPVLFRSLSINLDRRRHLEACNNLLTNSPHLRQYVRRVSFDWDCIVRHVSEVKEGMMESILSGLTRLDELLCSPIPFDALSSVLPQLSITTLYLQEPRDAVSSPLDLLPVLKAVASTVRSLTLEDLVLEDDLTIDDFASAISDRFKPLSVDNLCICWSHELWQYNTFSEAVEDAISTFTVPSKIKNIEVLISPMATPDEDAFLDLYMLDECLIDLRLEGSFELLTISGTRSLSCVDNGRHLPACSRLLAESPYIRQHIRKVVFESKDFPIYVPDEERRMIESILLGLPRLDELLCTSISLETLSSTLPQLSITKLYLKVEVYSALPILPVLNAIAATVRSLTLEELIFGDELTENEFTTIIKNGPIRMTALEELAIVLCANLPLASKFIQMPNLKALYCAGVDTALGDGILCALQTLVVAEAEVSEDFKPLGVDNLCIRWWHGHGHRTLPEAIEHAIATFTVPSKIKEIEILLSPSTRHRKSAFEGLNTLETRFLDLRRNGSFERFTITAEGDIPESRWILDKMPNLDSLGLLDVGRKIQVDIDSVKMLL